MKVKVFQCYDVRDIETDTNNWIDLNNVEIVDIKMSQGITYISRLEYDKSGMTQNVSVPDGVEYYTVLIYTDKKDKINEILQ